MGYVGDDDESPPPRRPQPHHMNSNDDMNPDPNASQRREHGLHRTRSTGHAPTPIVNVYNDVHQDANLRADSHSQLFENVHPYMYAPPSPIFRGHGGRSADELADELAEIRLERRMRSRSRGRRDSSSHSRDDGRSRGDFYKHELDRLEREKRDVTDVEQREAWKREEARIKAYIETSRLKDETPGVRVLRPVTGDTGMATSKSDVAEATVAEHTRNVFGGFKAIRNLENDLSASWQETASDGLSRFQVWASNLGAYHDRQDPRSADSRLRKTPDVQKRIVRLLGDLLEDLHGIYEILSGQREGEVEDADDPDVPLNSDGEAEPRSEISELWLTVENDVTSLMKVSILVQKNSVRNKLQHAVRAAEKISSSSVSTVWDRQRICHVYPKLEQNEWLLERLARMTTQRRNFLMYAEGHSQRIAHDSSGKFGNKSMFSRTTQALTQAPTLAPGQIETAALDRLDHFEDDDDMSDTSATTRGSQLDGQNNVRDLNLVPLSSVCKDGKPGICPYCYDAVLFVGRRKRKLWRRHAFADLMAYSCTFESCDRVSFGSLSAWATHEKIEHLRDWHCPICKDSCGSRSLLMAHIFDSHQLSGEALSYGQINNASPPIETAARCPFCDELESSERVPSLSNPRGTSINQKSMRTDSYQRHLSHHMEQIALLAKSASVEEDEVGDDSDVEAFSQATSLSSQGRTEYEEMDITQSTLLPGPSDLDPTAASTTDHEHPFKTSTSTSVQRPLEDSIDPDGSNVGQVEREKRKAEDREWIEFERRCKEKQEKKDHEEKEAQTKLDEAMRKRLDENGFTQSQIDEIMAKEQAKRVKNSTTTTARPLLPLRSRVPVYPKIHTEYISTETLRYYDVPWEYDRNDPSYIIILREMSKVDTERLFHHTMLLRSGTLLIDSSKGKKPEYASRRGRSLTRDGNEKRRTDGISAFKRQDLDF